MLELDAARGDGEPVLRLDDDGHAGAGDARSSVSWKRTNVPGSSVSGTNGSSCSVHQGGQKRGLWRPIRAGLGLDVRKAPRKLLGAFRKLLGAFRL